MAPASADPLTLLLRSMFSARVGEPVPAHLLALVDRLDALDVMGPEAGSSPNVQPPLPASYQ